MRLIVVLALVAMCLPTCAHAQTGSPKLFISVDMEGIGGIATRVMKSVATHVDILQSIPGMTKVDGFTVSYTATDADQTYRLIRLMYRFVRI